MNPTTLLIFFFLDGAGSSVGPAEAVPLVVHDASLRLLHAATLREEHGADLRRLG